MLTNIIYAIMKNMNFLKNNKRTLNLLTYFVFAGLDLR